MRKTAAGALALFLSLSLTAQTPTPPLTPLVRTVEVNVTNVDVIVTDGKGQRVTDLTRDDFVLEEDGAPQTITNFYAASEGKAVVEQAADAKDVKDAPARSEPPVPAAPKARIAIFVDNMHLTPLNRRQVLRAVGDFVAGSLGPNVEAAVSTWDHRLLPRGPFTNDGKALKDVLAKLEEEPAKGEQSLSERDQVFRSIDQALRTPTNDRTRDVMLRSAIGNVRSYALHLVSEVDDTLAALGVAVDQLSGVEGRKVLLYVSERLPQIPGSEMFQYLRESLGFGSPFRREVPTDMEFDRKDRFEDVVRKAHAAGVALYPFEARGLALDSSLSASRPASEVRLDPAREEMNNLTMLQYLARETGGSAIFSRNTFKEALEDVGRDFTTFYSLGYQSLRPVVGKDRRVKVSVRRPGLTVRSRSGHVEKSPEARVGDAVVSRLWFPKVQNPLNARLDTGQSKKKGKGYVLPLRFLVPYDKLTLVPEGDRMRGRLVFQVAALDDTGRLSPLRIQVGPIDMPRSALPDTAGKEFVFDTEVELRPVGQVVSFALTDEPSRLTSFVQLPLRVTAKEAK